MQVAQQKDAFSDFQVVYSYCRAQAIEDKDLVGVSSVTREAGVKFPVALTEAVWRKYVEVPTAVDGTPLATR